MTELHDGPEHSTLCQTVTRDGRTVRIEIYDDGADGWLLEIVDAAGNSTVWDVAFSTDQEALDEALKTIDEEGIDTLIGAPAGGQPGNESGRSVTAAEIDELDQLLADLSIVALTMDVTTLEGFLTSIVIGPRFVPPSAWLPWVWDMEEGTLEPEFENPQHGQRILSLIMRFHDALTHMFETDPESFEPNFWQDYDCEVAHWCEGFLLGFTFSDDAWRLLAVGQPTWMTPFLRLGTDEGIDICERVGDADKWMNEIKPSLLKIHAYWKLYQEDTTVRAHGAYRDAATFVRDAPKIGRNDPCPCGSGKKFKKCCGAKGTIATMR